MNTPVSHVVRILRQMLPHAHHGKSHWITNHTGYISFQAVVWEDAHGDFHAVIDKRTGFVHPRIEQVVDCGTFDTYRSAMRTAHRHAQELAYLRYAWVLAQ